MKYTKAFDVWPYLEDLRNGTLTLQRGQWIKCGPDSKPSRWYGTNGITLTAFHYPKANTKFMHYSNAMKQTPTRRLGQ